MADRVGCEHAPDMKSLALFANFLVVAKEKGIIVVMDEIRIDCLRSLTKAIHENLANESPNICKAIVKQEPPDDASGDKGTPSAATVNTKKKTSKRRRGEINV